MRTSEHTEENLTRIARYLGFENEPKWLSLRFAISISLALDETINMDNDIDFTGGKSYAWDVLTGKAKNELHGDQADYHNLMALIMANNEDSQLVGDKDFEKVLEFHCERGFSILASSWKDKSDVFEWLGQEF